MLSRLIAITLVILCPGLRADTPVRPVVDACLLQLAWESTPERQATLADACPDLLQALSRHGWDTTLEGPAAAELTASQLSQFVGLAERWSASRDLTLVPLGPVLADLDLTEPDERSLLDQAKAWFAELLPEGTEETIEDLLRRLIPDFDISDSTWSLIGDLLIAAIIGGGLWVVVIELARSGFLSRQERHDGRTMAAPTAGSSASIRRPSTPSALFDQLLALTGQRFQRSDAPSLSHREAATLLPALTGIEGRIQADLSRFSTAAERLRYGAWQPDDHELSGVMVSGEAVIAAVRRREPGTPDDTTT